MDQKTKLLFQLMLKQMSLVSTVAQHRVMQASSKAHRELSVHIQQQHHGYWDHEMDLRQLRESDERLTDLTKELTQVEKKITECLAEVAQD